MPASPAAPGTFEIAAAIRPAAVRLGGRQRNGYAALRCVRSGETTHYDCVRQGSARGLLDLAVRCGAGR